MHIPFFMCKQCFPDSCSSMLNIGNSWGFELMYSWSADWMVISSLHWCTVHFVVWMGFCCSKKRKKALQHLQKLNEAQSHFRIIVNRMTLSHMNIIGGFIWVMWLWQLAFPGKESWVKKKGVVGTPNGTINMNLNLCVQVCVNATGLSVHPAFGCD